MTRRRASKSNQVINIAPKTVFITGANGYIGNAVARCFVAAGWTTYGLVRSLSAATSLAQEEIVPIIGAIDDLDAHANIQSHLPAKLDAIVSTTENMMDYIPHYQNTIKLLRTLGAASLLAGTKSIVIFTSGCKDYGIGPHFDGAPDLAPHTEESPIGTVPMLTNRATYAQKIVEHSDVFTPVLVRPTNVYGRASSYYQAFFNVASKAAAEGKPLILTAPPTTILHALHVDDCGDAYVAIASHSNVAEIDGQAFNISAQSYETLDKVAQALVKEYQIKIGLRYIDEADAKEGETWPPGIINFPQWTDSTKLTKLTGWKHRRPLFTESIHDYRLAYEATKAAGHENIKKVDGLLEAWTKTKTRLNLNPGKMG
ncbi:NAD dependent epimerase/dehydratase [Colletotrichum abscissum]|uniref:NAD dependent epimerase/dehydratase n=1 Tax=Colletotrichum abscissum TaxID=1671311 RepID=A0A9Q0B4E7_9PEZI|nr:NAD dependent epimerase/dehydratase [Colletotrichum abscissum]KAI3552873.1 NAD dependent epimerase/dehydratase [Colletotrichum abscissum]KAK1516401.1 NAD dependent epimerase/dehydratase [Colletotrichum abscissum]